MATILDKSRHWFEHNWKRAVAIVASVAVLACVILLVSSLVSNHSDKAKNMYYQALTLPHGSDEAIKAFEAVISDSSSGMPAHLARLKLADIYYKNGDYPKAEELLTAAAKSSNELVKVVALGSLAACKEAAGRSAEAAEIYMKAYSEKKNPARGTSYYNAALAYSKAGNIDQAKKIYEELMKDDAEISSSELKEKSKEQLIWLSAQTK